MTDPEFNKYKLEYQGDGLGTELYNFIWDIVVRVTKRYPAAIYSPNGVWDEDAISGLCNDFSVEKLIRQGLLEYYLISLETVEQLMLVLKRDFRHYLINRHRKDELINLVRRLRQMLSTDSAFKECSSIKSSQTWALSGWEPRETVQQIDAVVRAMYTVSLLPLTRYSASSRKISHLISNEDLRRLIAGTLEHLGQCISFDMLVEALRYRLNLLEIEPISLDEPLDLTSDDSTLYGEIIASPVAVDELEIGEIAHRIFNQLSQRQKRTLLAYLSLEKPTLEGVTKETGVPKSTVSNDLDAINNYIASAELTEVEAEKLFIQLSELCNE